jgi:predicted DNA-binding transcriptional regulator AlpA
MRNPQKAKASTATARVRHHPKFLLLDRRAPQIASVAIGADPDILLDTKQLAEWLGVSVPWLEIGRCKGYGPPFKRLGEKLIKYRVGDCIQWLEARTHQSTSEYQVEGAK